MDDYTKICTLVFLQRDNEICLAMKKRGFGAGRWNGAGGKVEPGESIETAMVRECQEEIGVTPVRYHKIAVHDFRGVKNGEPWGNIGHTYVCDKWEGEPVETEEMAPKWFTVEDIPYSDMWPDDKLWLPLVLDGKLLHTKFQFDEQDAIIGMEITEVDQLAPEA